MSVNVNPETGIRYGVISFNSLQPWCLDDLFYGPDAVDLSYQAAYEEAKAQAKRDWQNLLEEASIAASETDPHMSDAERERFIENYIEQRHSGCADEEEFVSLELERFSDQCQIDEPVIEGTYDGVKYRISWLGGAPLLWVLDGPIGVANRLCSPCVPNAADLDGGFAHANEGIPNRDRNGGYECYVVPESWLAEQPEVTES